MYKKIFGAFLSLFFNGCCGKLTTVPSNAVVNAGENATLNCCTNGQTVYWAVEQASNLVYNTYDVNKVKFPRHSVNVDEKTGCYNLSIASVQSGDAKRYFCIEADTQLESTAELVVLPSAKTDPRCQSNISENGIVVEEQSIAFVCSIEFSGNWAPSTRWQRVDSGGQVVESGFVDTEVTDSGGNKTATGRLTVPATAELSGSRYQCLIYFNESRRHQSVTVRNVPHYNKTCSSSTVNVIYGPDSVIILDVKSPSSGRLMLRCTAEGSQTLMTYKWMNGSVLMRQEQELDLCRHRGNLNNIQCTVINNITKKSRDATLTHANITALRKSVTSVCDTNILVTVAYVVCASALFLILCTFVIAFLILRKGEGCTRTRPNRPDIVHNVPESPARPDENHVDTNDFEDSLEANAGANQPAGDADDSSESDRDSAIIRQVQEAHDYYNAASMYNVRNANIVALPTKTGSQNRPLPQPQPQVQQPQQTQQQQQRQRNAAFDAGEYADIDHRAKHYLGTSPVHNV